MSIWRMLIGCWIPKATNTTSECVIRNVCLTATMVAKTRLIVMLYAFFKLVVSLRSENIDGGMIFSVLSL